jgi:hypothetical protein
MSESVGYFSVVQVGETECNSSSRLNGVKIQNNRHRMIENFKYLSAPQFLINSYTSHYLLLS